MGSDGGKAVIVVLTMCFIAMYATPPTVTKLLDHWGYVFPWLTAVLMTSGWPVHLGVILGHKLTHEVDDGRVPLTLKLTAKLCAMGVLDSVHMITLAFAINWLPGSTYMLLKSTNIVFNVVESRIFLKKELTRYHAASVVLLLTSTAVLASHKSDHKESNGITSSKHLFGFIFAIISAFSNASQAVLASFLLKDVKKSTSMRTVAEAAFFNGISAWLVIIVCWLISREWTEYSAVWTDASHKDNRHLYIILCMVAVALTKQTGMFFKFAVISKSSALFAAVADVARRMIVVILVVKLFHESFPWQKAVACAMTVPGIALYIYGGHLLKQRAAARAKESPPLLSAVIPPGESVKAAPSINEA
ncbi:uncharacterized protein AMSG_10686 [Thecamonas trahens ATCC 50062]|uniref:Sugar phosphate transporter domain-containing protein n=1 Tax=Thecamonas trahens ATCC 50062 TaxID=461836 RepID=A0A0L0DS02_THETB|nr:hypothetical protein AMSG_10686 [Thecamonas trahens ATCC 50062]KNC55089.1 hypothetical protein AMSG_10686 [Thecamonas trahens ATCC 50062]|eukprot:XP_013753273.1 hypothetical protein AMSG_10686 [Thecamonas trahens ATCC 50062]